jgi:hypothetical protein
MKEAHELEHHGFAFRLLLCARGRLQIGIVPQLVPGIDVPDRDIRYGINVVDFVLYGPVRREVTRRQGLR